MASYVFVDSRISNFSEFLTRLSPEMRVVLVDPSENGFIQIAKALEGISDINAIHILSHGADGMLLLGASSISNVDLQNYRGELAAIGGSLSEKGDILLYGCDVAGRESGTNFVAQLASLTGADVAASVDATGAWALGGNWVLEVNYGTIESTALNLVDYAGLLDVINGDSDPNNLLGTNNGDLITGLDGNDTIDGGAGFDNAIYSGPSAGYSFAWSGTNLIVNDVNPANGNEGADQLSNVEVAQFADGTVNIGPTNEFRVNTFTANSQDLPAIAALPGGGYVIAWESFAQDNVFTSGIYAQRYDAAGRQIGGEFRVNTFVDTDQVAPAVAALNNGDFVVAWQSIDQDGSQNSIYGQRYDAAGTPLGAEFRANTFTNDEQIEPAVATLANGGFVLVWSSVNQASAGSNFDIYARRYDAEGTSQGPELLVNSFTTSLQAAPAVAALTNGGFVVTWESFNPLAGGNSGYDIVGRRYDADGVATSAEFAVDQTSVGPQIFSSVVVLRDGGFVVSYGNELSSAYYLDRFDAAGALVGGDTLIASSGGAFGTPDLAALADGGFVVTWQQSIAGEMDIYAQRFDATGVKVGDELAVNATTANPQEAPAVAALSDGGFVITWQSAEQDGFDYGIYARRFDASGNPVATTLSGDSGDNTIVWLGPQSIVIDGGAGADTVSGGSGNDLLDGGAGVDMATYRGTAGSYTITRNGLATTVNGPDGSDTLTGIERLQFGDGTVRTLENAERDFGDDGKSDILWRNDNGSVLTWEMNGAAISSSPFIASVGNDWKIADGTGDYNGDGKSDVLWRNDNGNVLTWEMNGAAISSSPFIASVGNDWKIADGAGDYNGDGKSDILWRNDNGSILTWQMDGGTITSSTFIAAVPSDWKIADGSGDYNGDGKSDILWRNDNGNTLIWSMDGASIGSATAVASVPTDWKIADGSGDYNGDGKSDVLWRNDNGNTLVWFMNGATITSAAAVASVPLDWTIADGSSDYNGDGKSDVLWRNDNGNVLTWTMDGGVISAAASVATVPADWHIQS